MRLYHSTADVVYYFHRFRIGFRQALEAYQTAALLAWLTEWRTVHAEHAAGEKEAAALKGASESNFLVHSGGRAIRAWRQWAQQRDRLRKSWRRGLSQYHQFKTTSMVT